jgi:hypothetical protein
MTVDYTPITIDGVSGYFLPDDEYQRLISMADDPGEAMYAYLTNEVNNLRNVVQDAWTTVTKLKYDLGNA